MAKVDDMTRDDWLRASKKVKTMYDTAVDLACITANSLGKAHPVTTKANRVYRLMAEIKSDMDNLAFGHAERTFGYDELCRLFYS